MKTFRLLSAFLAVATTVIGNAAYSQLTQPSDIPGAIRLDNGLILRGMCGTTSSFAPNGQDQRLEMRRIEQQIRTYYVSTRTSDPVVPDNQVLPRHSFDVPQKRTNLKPMDYLIGQHRTAPFDNQGRSFLELFLAGDKTIRIDVGITKVNSQFVTVSSLSHRWEYWVSLSQIPDSVLYVGGEAPCILRSANGFEKGETRLNMIQMLLEGEKFIAARDLIADTQAEYPDLNPLCERLRVAWDDSFGQKVIDELNLMESTGKFASARRYARQWPEGQLAPVVEVRALQLTEKMDEANRRVAEIRQSLGKALAEIEDPDRHRRALSIWNTLKDRVTPGTLDRFDSYELFSLDDTLSAESRFALAATGWMLGAEAAFDDFIEADGLFEIRHLLTDYLQTDLDEVSLRNDLVGRIRKQEGFSIDRVAQLIRNLEPTGVVEVTGGQSQPEIVRFSADNEQVAAVVQLPSEYSTDRPYPMLIAVSRGGMTVEQTLEWWSLQANRHGYILVVPELYPAQEAVYHASADDHRRITGLIRSLKSNFHVADDRVFVAGHGIGGEAAMDIASAQPSMFAGVISLGGRGRRHIQWTAQNSTDLPWYIVVGSRQPDYFSRLDLLLRTLFKRNVRTRKYVDTVFVKYRERGFEAFGEEVPRLFQWMALQRRPWFGVELEATILRSTDSNWSWLELNEIPERFACLDPPNSYTTNPKQIPGKTPGRLSARITNNYVRLMNLPSSGFLKLSPELTEIDFEKPISVRTGTRARSVNYEPSVGDLLDDYYRFRDRLRLCYMKVPVRK